MKHTYYSIFLVLSLLGGCGHLPRTADATKAEVKADSKELGQEATGLPAVALDERMLYEFLLGDIALQRGRADLALQVYWDLAKTTRDPRVVRRAAQLAFESRQMEKSLDAVTLWQEIEPNAILPRQMLVSLLLGGGRYSEATPHVRSWLASEPKGTGKVFLHLYSLLSGGPDKSAALNWLTGIAQPYPEVAEAHWAIAQIASAINKNDLALTEARRAQQLRPEWDAPVLLEAQLLMPTQPNQALALLGKYLDANPNSKDAQLVYARKLVEQKKYAEARSRFQQLLVGNADNTELVFAIALLSLQMGDLERAESELKETLARGKKDADMVHYYIGQLREEKKDDLGALAEYRQVRKGEYEFSARMREVGLLNKAGKLDESLAILKNATPNTNAQRVAATLIEAQILRFAKRNEDSYQVLLGGLEKFPNHPQLLFEAAMAAERLGKTEQFELSLRKLLQVEPSNAHAYNALGYSLLDRNVRVDEGMALVEKAYQLMPDDAAITDSVGWGYYRLGKLDKSVEFLRKAYAANPDPEIAAHLGEVLWMQGSKDEASKVWQDTLQAHPDNEPLRNLIKKFIQ